MLSKFHHFQHLAELYHGYHVIHRYVVRWPGALPARRGAWARLTEQQTSGWSRNPPTGRDGPRRSLVSLGDRLEL